MAADVLPSPSASRNFNAMSWTFQALAIGIKRSIAVSEGHRPVTE
jgi:hypothetical protein